MDDGGRPGADHVHRWLPDDAVAAEARRERPPAIADQQSLVLVAVDLERHPGLAVIGDTCRPGNDACREKHRPAQPLHARSVARRPASVAIRTAAAARISAVIIALRCARSVADDSRMTCECPGIERSLTGNPM